MPDSDRGSRQPLARARWMLVLLGASASLIIHAVFGRGWWLNSVEALRDTAIPLVALGLGVASRQRSARDPAGRFVSLATGVALGLAVAFIAAARDTGPGTIVPIVMIFSTAISACAVGLGWAAGHGTRLLSNRIKKTPRRHGS